MDTNDDNGEQIRNMVYLLYNLHCVHYQINVVIVIPCHFIAMSFSQMQPGCLQAGCSRF
jgi:hypothetical protein